MDLNQINTRTKEIFTRFDQIREEKRLLMRAAVGEDNLVNDSKVDWKALSKLSDEEEQLRYELFRTLKEDAEKQGFMPVDNGSYWKIPDDQEELQDLIEHKRMLIEKYPEDVCERIALHGLEMRLNELKGEC